MDEANVKDVQMRLSSLMEDVLEKNLKKNSTVQLVDRIKVNEALQDALASDKSGDNQVTEAYISQIEETCNNLIELLTKITATQTENQEKHKLLGNLQSEQLAQITEVRKLKQDIENLESEHSEFQKNCAADNDVQKLIRKVDKRETHLQLFRHMLQRLIHATNVDWTKDATLLDTVIDLGMPLSEKLQSLSNDKL